jgi:nicotinamidase-related amidase
MFPRHSALVVIDAQRGFFENETRVAGAASILERMVRIVAKARMEGVPIVFVRHETDLDIDGPLHPELVKEGDAVVGKSVPDAFQSGELKARLDALEAKGLCIMGFQTEMCIEATIESAIALGYEVALIDDCHSTFDGAEAGMTGSQVVEKYNSKFAAMVHLASSDAIVA